jgi:hypothetical protein
LKEVLSWRLSITMEAAFCVEALGRGFGEVRQAGDPQHRQSEDSRQFLGGLSKTLIDRLAA